LLLVCRNKVIFKRISLYERKEICFIDKLEKVLKPMGLKGKRQYKIGNYRIDYYISKLNIAIEYDENNHQSYTYKQQEGRQNYIEDRLHCTFIRVTDKIDDYINIGIILKNMKEDVT